MCEFYIERSVDYGIPGFIRPALVEYASLVCRIGSGFFLEDVAPVKNIDKITAPVLFIHGDSDDFTPPAMNS